MTDVGYDTCCAKSVSNAACILGGDRRAKCITRICPKTYRHDLSTVERQYTIELATAMQAVGEQLPSASVTSMATREDLHTLRPRVTPMALRVAGEK